MINLVIDPLLIPLLVIIVEELLRVEGRLSRLEEKFELLVKRDKHENKH